MFFKLYERLGRVELALAKYCLIILCALVFLSAAARTLGHPMSWTVDMATFLFAWSVFMGADAAMRRDMLISIDLVVERFSEKMQLNIKIMNHIIIAVFLVAMVFYGFILSYTTYHRSFSGLPWLSYTWVTISVPLGCLLMLMTTFLKTKELIAKRRMMK